MESEEGKGREQWIIIITFCLRTQSDLNNVHPSAVLTKIIPSNIS